MKRLLCLLLTVIFLAGCSIELLHPINTLPNEPEDGFSFVVLDTNHKAVDLINGNGESIATPEKLAFVSLLINELQINGIKI